MPTPEPEVRAGLADNGRVLSLAVGQRLVVTLAPGWTPARAEILGGDPGPATTPLRLETATGASAATFTALAPGQALISAQKDAAYAPTTPGSTPFQHAFHLTVQVRPRPGFQMPFASAGLLGR